MKTKRIIALTLILMLSVSAVFTGCQKKGEVKPEETKVSGQDSAVESATPTTAPEPAAKLKWYLLNWAGPQKDTKMVFDELSKITKEKINATIEGEFISSGDYTNKMNMKIQSGEKFDICFTSSWAINYYTNAVKGAFADITDLADKYAKDTMSIIDPKFIEGAKIKGKLYAIPTNKELSTQNVWLVNVPVAEKYGIDYKTAFNTMDIKSFDPYFAKVKAGEGKDFIPFVSDHSIFNSILHVDNLQNTNYGTPFDPNDPSKSGTNVVNRFALPEAMDLALIMRDFNKKGYLPKNAHLADKYQTELDALRKSGKWLLMPCSYYPLWEVSVSTEYGYKVDAVKPQKPFVPTWQTVGAMEAVSATSENKEKAVMFLNLVNTDKKIRNMVGSGIEGIHYTLKDNIITKTEEGKNSYNTWNIGIANPIGLLYLEPGQPENIWDEFKKYNEEGVPTPTFGFVFNTEPVKDEIAALENLKTEFERVIWSGSVDPKVYIPKYLAKIDAQGGKKVAEEMQRQIDEWKAANSK